VVTRAGFLVVVAIIAAGCGSGGSTPASGNPGALPTGALSSAAASSGGGSVAPSAASGASEQPIGNQGPAGWERGPYQLAGGTYRLDWETDGSCSALYFGIVGVSNGYRESPPTAGDVALKDMAKGSRTITDVPPGSYFFNVSNVACKKYSATLTRVP
jgi:hypothetical protein